MRYFSALLLLVAVAPAAATSDPFERQLGRSSKDSRSKDSKDSKDARKKDSGDSDDGGDDYSVSYTFPPTDTREFVHGLCAMGAKKLKAVSDDKDLKYKSYPKAFGNGVQVWANRGQYKTYDVEGKAMCDGGMFLQPTLHKKIDKETEIKIEAVPVDGEDVTICAFVEVNHLRRDGQWDVELPKNGFGISDRFGWNKGGTGYFKSYCKVVKGHEKWRDPAVHRKYTGGQICAKGTGDPHMTTYDGVKYDCQGEGDFVMSKSLESDFEYQGRFEKVPGKSVTTTQGVVLQTGIANEPKVEVSYSKRCELAYFLDGKEVDLESIPNTGNEKVEFYAKGKDRFFIYESGVTLKVNFRSWRGDCLLNTYLCLPDTISSQKIVGIFGSPDNNKNNDFMSRSGGVYLPTPKSRKEKNEYCSSTWCVAKKSDNLFMDPVPTCSDAFDPEMDKKIEEAPEAIKEACKDELACIVDTIMADGDIEEGIRTLEDEETPPEAPEETERKTFPAPPKEVLPVKPEEPEPKKEEPKEITPKTTTSTPKKASSSGDPHFKTWTGDKFDYHGECDLVLIDNPTFANGLGLRVHIRTTRVKYFSFIEKVAVQIGDETLEFDNDVENFYINGEHVGQNQQHHKTRLAGFVVRRDAKALSIRLQDEGTKSARQAGLVAKIDLHTRKNGFPAVIVDAGKTDLFKGSLGLLGEFGTGRPLARDGATELEVDTVNAEAFALEWQVRDTDPMLFKDARFPQFPQVCVPPKKMPLGRLGLAKATEEAKEACAHWKHDVEDCIFDVMATRDVGVAEEGHIVHVE